MQERKFDTFDQFADDYRTIHTENIKISGADSDYFSKYRIEEIHRVEKLANTNASKGEKISILDIGSGDGNAARFFIEYFRNSTVYGIDITDKVVQKAIDRNLPNCHFQVYDGENIPFADNTFDIIFLVGTLHHVDKKYHLDLMKQAFRVLKKGGRMYQFEHNPWNPITQKLVKDCPFDTDAVLVTAPYVKQLERNAGFEKVRTKFTLFFPRFAIFKPFLFLEKYLGWLPIGGQYYISATK
ncbi:MAG: class I SAM-dependent methyltransferase [Bacteroidota bacterium]|nr:class I SAM-dependent methyltransferase [Bacteroidota bacterium]